MCVCMCVCVCEREREREREQQEYFQERKGVGGWRKDRGKERERETDRQTNTVDSLDRVTVCFTWHFTLSRDAVSKEYSMNCHCEHFQQLHFYIMT